MIKEYSFKYRREAPEGELDLKKFTKDLKWGLLCQIGQILVKEGDIKFHFDETGCTATLDFFVDRDKDNSDERH